MLDILTGDRFVAKHGKRPEPKPEPKVLKEVKPVTPSEMPPPEVEAEGEGKANRPVKMPPGVADRINRIVGVVRAKTGDTKFFAADLFRVRRELFDAWLAQVEAWAEGL